MTKGKHGLKGKPSNNPNGKPSTGKVREQVGIYIDPEIIIKLGGKSAIRTQFSLLVDKLLKK